MIKTEASDKIISLLKSDLIQNLNILGIIENVPNAQVFVDNVENPKGVLVNKGYFNYVYAREESFIDELIRSNFKDDGFYGFSGLKKNIREGLGRNFITQWETPCELYYLPEGNFNPGLITMETRSVDIKDAEKINHYYAYKSEVSLDNIKNDILHRPSSAIYVDGEIVCWVLVHDDNSMGIMYTMEEHRGKGYASVVTADLSDKLLKQGRIPFLQINRFNGMSPGLAKKCGFVKCGDAIWFGGLKGAPKEFVNMPVPVYEALKSEFGNDELFFKYIKPEVYEDLFLFFWDMKHEDARKDGFEAMEVKDEEDLSTWCDITSRGYSKSPKEAEEFREGLYTSIMHHRDNYKLFLGKEDNKFVSSLGIYTIPDVASCLCYISSLTPEADYLLVREMVTILKLEEWGFTAVRCPKERVQFYKELGAVRLNKGDSQTCP